MKMRRKTILIGAGILVVVAVVSGMAARGRGGKTPEVQTAKVVRQKIIQKVNGTGKIQPKTQVEISADVSAKIIKLPVVEGQWVEKGAFLVGLARERYAAAVQSAEASVSSAEANASLVSENMSRAENEYKRSKELVASKLESQASFEAKQAEYRVEWSKRLGFVAFGGLGGVERTWSEFRTDQLLPAGGFGLRYNLDKKNHINYRVDVGFGRAGRTLSIGVGEAF